MTHKQLHMLEQVEADGPSSRKLFERVFNGTASPRQVIKAKCLECTWLDRKAVEECTASECPAWTYRPFVGLKCRKRSTQAVLTQGNVTP